MSKIKRILKAFKNLFILNPQKKNVGKKMYWD